MTNRDKIEGALTEEEGEFASLGRLERFPEVGDSVAGVTKRFSELRKEIEERR